MQPPTVRDILHALDIIAPPYLCLGDDPRGLLIGDPDAPAARIATCLDVTAQIVETAASRGVPMLIAHHPLIFHPLKRVRADDTFPAPVVAAAIRASIAVACAHTNWDVAPGGINDVLAGLLGLDNIRPLRTTYREPLVKIAVFVPPDHRERLLDAMATAGAGAIGDYNRCGFWVDGVGTFRPLPGAEPFTGTIGEASVVSESRLEMICPERGADAIITAMRAAHPYEEVAFDVYALKNHAASFGIGRIGTLPAPVTLAALRSQIADALDFDAIRVAGPADRQIITMAVCGGAGAELVPDAIAAGADCLVTSDVRHHEFVDADARGFVLIDAGHAATETPGARELAKRLADALPHVAVDFIGADGSIRRS